MVFRGRWNRSMITFLLNISLCAGLLLSAGALILSGCGKNAPPPREDEVLIQVGNSVFTAKEFQRSFDQTASNYSANLFRNRQTLQDVTYRLLNQLAEELIILERARELQLNVTVAELQAAVDDFEKDFPEGQLQTSLVESGVSLSEWRASLKKRLLIEKVIAADLNTDWPEKSQGKKAEATYTNWIGELKKSYDVKINWALWETMSKAFGREQINEQQKESAH